MWRENHCPGKHPYRKLKKAQAKAEELIGQTDRERFVEAVDTELLSLTEYNIARHRVRPSEFMRWKSGWK